VTIRETCPLSWENVVTDATWSPELEGTFQMQVSRRFGSVKVDFDDERLVANAGLFAPATLAERLGFKELLDESIDLGDVAGHANPGAKAMTIMHAMLAGADSIDDCDVLRSGATSPVLGHRVAAPSTLGTFLGGVLVGAFASARQRVGGDAHQVVGCGRWAGGSDSAVHDRRGQLDP